MKMQISVFKQYQVADELGTKDRLFLELLRQSDGRLKNVISFYLENLNHLQLEDFYKLVSSLRNDYYRGVVFHDFNLDAAEVSVDNRNCRAIERILFFGYYSEDIYLGGYLQKVVDLLNLFDERSTDYLDELSEYKLLLLEREEVAKALGKHLFFERWKGQFEFEQAGVPPLNLDNYLSAFKEDKMGDYTDLLQFDPRIAMRAYVYNMQTLTIEDLYSSVYNIRQSYYPGGEGLWVHEPDQVKLMRQYCYDVERLLFFIDFRLPLTEWLDCDLALQDFFTRFQNSDIELPSQFPGYKELVSEGHARLAELAKDERYKQKIWARQEMGH